MVFERDRGVSGTPEPLYAIAINIPKRSPKGQLMASYQIHRSGSIDADAPSSDFSTLFQELDEWQDNTEFVSVAVTHGSEWCLSAFPGGFIVLENLKIGGIRHMEAVPNAKILQLWRQVVSGNIAALESEAWLPGINLAASRLLVLSQKAASTVRTSRPLDSPGGGSQLEPI